MNTAYSYEIQPLDEHSISIERVYGTTPVVVIPEQIDGFTAVSYTHLRAHET